VTIKRSIVVDFIKFSAGFWINVWLFSYSIENLLNTNDLTLFSLVLILVFQLAAILLEIIQNKKIYSFNYIDLAFLILFNYLTFNLIFISNLTFENIISLYLGSLIGYLIGRFSSIDTIFYFYKSLKFFIPIILGALLFYFYAFTKNPFNLPDFNRVGIGLGVGLLILYLLNKSVYSKLNIAYRIIFFTLGFIMWLLNIIVLTGRGSTIFTISAFFFALIITKKIKFKSFILFLALFLIFYIFLTTNSIMIQFFPWLKRFTISGILNDPSVTGNYYFVGRLDLYKESLNLISSSPLFGNGYFSIYSHNMILETLASYGFIGLFILILFLFEISKKIYKLIKFNPNDEIISFVIACFLFTFFYYQTSFGWYSYKTFFFFSGVISNLKSKRTKKLKP